LVHPDHHGRGLAAMEPLHLDLDGADVHVAEVHGEVDKVGRGPAETVALGGQLGQGGGDVDEVLVGIPSPTHPLHVELEDRGGQSAPVEHAHCRLIIGGCLGWPCTPPVCSTHPGIPWSPAPSRSWTSPSTGGASSSRASPAGPRSGPACFGSSCSGTVLVPAPFPPSPSGPPIRSSPSPAPAPAPGRG